MKALVDVKPTPEQLALFSRARPGIEIIRGAAGSGKTTTALLKLRASVGFYLNRLKRQPDRDRPVKVLVLTFNRTLRGYVAELAKKQFSGEDKIILEISTFSKWALARTGNMKLLDIDQSRDIILALPHGLKLSPEFIVDEAAYVLGKFLPSDLPAYVQSRRDGRGSVPRLDRATREQILAEIIVPYLEYKQKRGLLDFHDLATQLIAHPTEDYEVVVVDETQDFSANEVRAVLSQLSPEYTATFVLDSAQRIYPRSFTWSEVGVSVRPENSFKLQGNYRNTRQIAHLAFRLMEGLKYDDDGAMPNYEHARRDGSLPLVLSGSYPAQVQFCLEYIRDNIDLQRDSVAFLHLKGHGWFKYLRTRLDASQLPYVEITQKSEWPTGIENIALSTLHSAKGLEFDYVFMIGMDGEIADVPDAEDEGDNDERTAKVRRLVAMAVGRARKAVIIGYAKHSIPDIAKYFAAPLVEVREV